MRESAPARQRRSRSRLFSLGVLLFLVAWSAGTSRWMGYSQEENDAAGVLLGLLLGERPAQGGLEAGLTRHGLVASLAKLPYAALARLSAGAHRTPGGGRDVVREALFSLAPQVETALLVLILALWIGRATGAPATGNRWALAALVSTPLWPYAYMGMETTQSLFLMLTAFLAIGPSRLPGPWRVPLLTIAGALAVSAKSQGFLLLPAVVYLLWRARRTEEGRVPLLGVPRLALALGVVLGARAASSLAIASWVERYWRGAAPFPGGAGAGSLVRSPFDALMNLYGFIAAPNKGLLWFAPLVAWGLCLAVQQSIRRSPHDRGDSGDRGVGADATERTRERARFVVLVAAGLLGALSCIVHWADETWGPRYLHSLLAPAILVLALAPERRRRALLVFALLLGVTINALGVAVHYGTLHKIASRVEATTLESFQFDPRWNHARFNARVLAAWLRQATGGTTAPAYRNPTYGWMAPLPAELAPREVDLGDLARPQPVVLRVLVDGELPQLKAAALGLVAAGLLGILLLALSCRRTALDGSRGVAPDGSLHPGGAP